MARYTCPSCGSAFNGKRCRECLFEVFDEEIGHRLHTHKGEPLVIQEPQHRPRGKRDPLSWDRRTRKRKGKLPKGLIWVLVIFFLNPLLSLGFMLVETVTDTVAAVSDARRVPAYPEPQMVSAVLSPTAEVLWESEDFTVWADWGRETEPGTIPLMVENRTDYAVNVSSRQIVMEDFLTEDAYLYCEVPSRKDTGTDFTMAEGELELSETDLAFSGLEQVETVSFQLVIYETKDYETLVETESIVLELEEPIQVFAQTPELLAREGEVFLQGEGILGRYLGYEAGYDPDTFEDGTLLFCLENSSDREITIFTEESTLNGEDLFLTLWCELPPHTRTVTRMYLYGAEDAGIDTLAEAEELWMKNVVHNAWEGGAGLEMEYTIRFH